MVQKQKTVNNLITHLSSLYSSFRKDQSCPSLQSIKLSGSHLQGIATADSDVDLILFTDSTDMESHSLLNKFTLYALPQLTQVYQQPFTLENKAYADMSVPCVTFSCSSMGLTVDLSHNNQIGYDHSVLMQDEYKKSNYLKILLKTWKEFLKRHGVPGSKDGGFASTIWAFMCIHANRQRTVRSFKDLCQFYLDHQHQVVVMNLFNAPLPAHTVQAVNESSAPHIFVLNKEGRIMSGSSSADFQNYLPKLFKLGKNKNARRKGNIWERITASEHFNATLHPKATKNLKASFTSLSMIQNCCLDCIFKGTLYTSKEKGQCKSCGTQPSVNVAFDHSRNSWAMVYY
eukprot:TRINITY_DN4887_c0_g1_i1.p1 TRINITY_DN4887_c0_g1~~TRINITY_DN4887_c0_g1_i1.p1  ORF type:complete len:357 (-),score=42.19 TRINITY_DN4887_c0_g1_i1:64-1095(-)